jgi:hypothetical protein
MPKVAARTIIQCKHAAATAAAAANARQSQSAATLTYNGFGV